MSIKVEHVNTFLCDIERQYQARTMVNYSSALQWHLAYLRFLLHVDTKAKNVTEEEIQKAVRSR
jgi:hypothetical protein